MAVSEHTATTGQESNGDEVARVGAPRRHEEALVGAAIGGDELAFEDLVSRYRQTALRVATGIVGSNQAEDVVQDALLLAHRSLATLRDRTKFSRWLMAITRWRALRASRQESRRAFGRVPFDESVLETFSDLASCPRQSDVVNELLIAALASIPPEYAEVIRYHFLHDMPHQKIAEFLDISL
ncbi:MAG TPA: RNA polymerase sigma factor, partial [Polyangiaceae bacterium]